MKKTYLDVWGRNSSYFAFGKDGGFRFKNFPHTAREYLIYGINKTKDDLIGARCLFDTYFRMYNNAKQNAKNAFTYEKEGKAYENWKKCAENLYQLKLKVIEYTNKIKSLKCELRQTKVLLSLYDAENTK